MTWPDNRRSLWRSAPAIPARRPSGILAEKAVEQEANVVFAAVDPENRELADYFAGVQQPPSYDPVAVAKWVEQFLSWVMKNQRSAVIDFGGGDTSLTRLITEVPDIVEMMQGAGVHPVALYLLSPRLGDLSALGTLEAAGFRPKATAIIRNEGVADPTLPRERAFARTMRHPAYEAALACGAVPLWMPRLHAAKEGITIQQDSLRLASYSGYNVIPF